jgi:hypothetical protein
VNRIFVQIIEFSAATGTEPFGTQFGFRHGPILRAIGCFTWPVARRLSIVDPLRLSLEKAVGIPDAIHRSCTALATIVVRTISTSGVELIARDFFQPHPENVPGSEAWVRSGHARGFAWARIGAVE